MHDHMESFALELWDAIFDSCVAFGLSISIFLRLLLQISHILSSDPLIQVLLKGIILKNSKSIVEILKVSNYFFYY